MVYMGSKNRIAKYILPFLTKYLTPDRWYVEPFAGGMNIMDKINHQKRIANDVNEYLIELWKYLQYGGILPQFISKEEYYNVNSDKQSYPLWYVGHIGINCSRLGKFFGGYVHEQNGRNYQLEHINNTMAQVPLLEGVIFTCYPYYELPIPQNSIVYCDPPYAGTTNYKAAKGVDHEAFFEWCRDKTAQGNDVLISEYTSPNDFIPVWKMQLTTSIHPTNTHKSIEKLFVHESIADKYIEKTLFD